MRLETRDKMAAISTAIFQHRYRLRKEKTLHEQFVVAFKNCGLRAEPEYSLSPMERVDFMVDGIAVEVKVGGGFDQHLRQCLRYAQHDSVSGVVLVGTRKGSPPSELNGKPFLAVCIAKLLL